MTASISIVIIALAVALAACTDWDVGGRLRSSGDRGAHEGLSAV
jgi:hypothetical protein